MPTSKDRKNVEQMQEVNAKDLYHLIPIPLLQNSIEKGETYHPSTYQQASVLNLCLVTDLMHQDCWSKRKMTTHRSQR